MIPCEINRNSDVHNSSNEGREEKKKNHLDKMQSKPNPEIHH